MPRLNEYWMLPLAGVALCISFVAFIVAAVQTRDWLYLVGAFVCFKLIAAK